MDAARQAANERALLRAFVALLEREEDALVAGDVARIEDCAHEKSACVESLAAVLGSGPADDEIRALREQARRANARNGGLIVLRTMHVRDRLAALGALGDEGPTYGADGMYRSGAIPGAARHGANGRRA